MQYLVKNSIKTNVVILGSLVLAACATNQGDFGTQNVIYPSPIEEEKPDVLVDDTSGGEREVEELETLMKPGLGFALKTKRRNLHYNDPEDQKDIDANDIEAININKEDLDFQNGNPDYFTKKLAEHQKYGGYTGYSDFTAKSDTEKNLRDLQYVKSGVVVDIGHGSEIDYSNNIFKKGPVGYVYYQGYNPSKALPVGQSVSYKGTWDFATNAKKDRNIKGGTGGPGDAAAATSIDDNVNRHDFEFNNTNAGVGHTSEFEVDFGTKKLAGKLIRNGYLDTSKPEQQEIKTMYDINADLKGNRFRGTATSKDNQSTVFGSDSKTLEGGFYGPNAEELGGKFIADDNSLFTVFTGKRDQDNSTVETKFDATNIEFKLKEASTPNAPSLTKVEATTFGNATTLVINGRSFSLLPPKTDDNDQTAQAQSLSINKYDLNDKQLTITTCCSNLNYIKFGNFFMGESTDAESLNYFLTGERTANSIVATQTGEVNYKGTWAGVLTSKGGTPPWYMDVEDPNVSGAGKALLNFDFSTKKFEGGLYGTNKINPTLILAGSIDNNGFTGTAKTKSAGFTTDDGSTGEKPIIHIDAIVNGGFYGPTAEEVGGVIFDNTAGKDNVAAVFGAKRQVVVDK